MVRYLTWIQRQRGNLSSRLIHTYTHSHCPPGLSRKTHIHTAQLMEVEVGVVEIRCKQRNGRDKIWRGRWQAGRKGFVSYLGSYAAGWKPKCENKTRANNSVNHSTNQLTKQVVYLLRLGLSNSNGIGCMSGQMVGRSRRCATV